MASCLVKVWRSWVKVCSAINRFFESLFYNWASVAGKHPGKVIFIGIFVAIALAAGFARFKLQAQTERLFFPVESISKDNLARAQKSFPQKSKPDEFIITMNNGRDSVLNANAFQTALRIHERLMKETNIENICTKVGPQQKCLIKGPLELFNYNASLMTDSAIKPTLLAAIQNPSRLMITGRTVAIDLDTVLGHLTFNNTDIEAAAIRMMYFQVFPETDDVHKESSDIQKIMIDIFQEEEKKMNGLKLYYLTGRSVDDGISESSGGDISLVVVSITLMCVFSAFVLISLRDPPGGHVIAGNMGIVCIALAIGSGFGLVMLSGQYFVAFVGTLPFLVLGVGIDDMFIIIDALDALPSDVTGVERLQKTLSKVGASVTMTTITDVVAFAISSSTQFPAVQYFCFYAMTSILFGYLIIMTVLVGFLSIDIKRIESGRWDIIPCKKTPNYVPWKQSSSTISKKLMGRWAKVLMNKYVRIIVCFVSLGLLAAGIYGTLNLDEKFDLKQLAPDGSYFITFQDKQREYFPIGYSVDVIVDDVNLDYTKKEIQNGYVYLDQICNENKYMKNKTLNWMTSLLHWSNYSSSSPFYENLNLFLKSNPMFYSDLRFVAGSNNTKIQYSRMVCYDKEDDDWIFRRDAMLELRDDFKKKSNITSDKDSVFPISLNYFYREQIVSVPRETVQNLILCAAAILVITTPYLVHPLVILIVFFGFVSLVVELFGLMVIWGVALNSISMITSIMSIGFAVDYSAHVAHSYLLASGETPEARMIEALESIGSSVFMGGFTTFLGILVMVFGKSEIFRIFFKIVFGIVVIGLLNGLVFLPCFLTLFVRTKVNITDEEHSSSSSPNNENVYKEKSSLPNGGDIVLKNQNAVDAIA